MREIGYIKLVQVQRSSLKAGQRPYSYYDPTPLLVVERLRLEAGGVLGLMADGDPIVDVHHTAHAASKNRGENSISIGFTSHYRAMRERFGAQLTDGIAGENILVESERSFKLEDLGAQIVLQTGDGMLLALGDLRVAAPCVEFSQFAAAQGERLPAEALKATLQFLDGGMRGFYARLADQPAQAELRAGDRVFVLS